jgi:hypothetical protein
MLLQLLFLDRFATPLSHLSCFYCLSKGEKNKLINPHTRAVSNKKQTKKKRNPTPMQREDGDPRHKSPPHGAFASTTTPNTTTPLTHETKKAETVKTAPLAIKEKKKNRPTGEKAGCVKEKLLPSVCCCFFFFFLLSLF